MNLNFSSTGFDGADVSAHLGPARLYFGDGAALGLHDVLRDCGVNGGAPGGRVLLVADRDVVRLELAAAPVSALTANGFEVDVFSDVVGEPELAVVQSLIEKVRAAPYIAVIGLGGGSAMDMAKLAAALAANAGEVGELVGAVHFDRPPLPLVLVPTTAGTGAEATKVSMLAAGGQKVIIVSPHLVPAAAVLDPTLTLSLPPKVTASTGIDALSHALEALMSKNATPFTDAAALTAVGVVARFLEVAYREPSNLEARRAMMFAAYQAGLSLNAGVVLGHSIAYTVANRARLPHGVSCAVALPYCAAYNARGAENGLERVAALLGARADGETGASAVVDWLASLNERLGIPASLQEVGVDYHDLSAMADECLSRYPRPNNPVPVEREGLSRLYEHLFTGDIGGYAAKRLEHASVS